MNAYSINGVSVSINQQATAVLHLHEAVKPSTYQAVISIVKKLFAEGYAHLVVDLTCVPRLNLTTLFTLYSLAAITNQQQPANPEGGWNALHEMQNKLMGQTVTNLCLCSPQHLVAQALLLGGFADIVAIWPTLSMAIKSFSPPVAKPVYIPIHSLPTWPAAAAQ